MRTEYIFSNDGNHLVLEGDFGFVKYEGKVYFSTEIKFFSKSMHSVYYKFINSLETINFPWKLRFTTMIQMGTFWLFQFCSKLGKLIQYY